MPPESTIRALVVTPVAFDDYPLLFCGGVHEPLGVRTIVEIHCDDGVVGLGESYGDHRFAELLSGLAGSLVGCDIFDLNGIGRTVQARIAQLSPLADYGAPGAASVAKTVRSAMAPLELACLDAQGHLLGRPVSDLLGGRVRDEVAFAGYLFYKWAGHPGSEPDSWGAALDPAGIVEQARRMTARFGFESLKLKGGVFPPDEEADTLRALKEAFPRHPLRVDPNGAWTVPTSLRMAGELDGILEYLEDPTTTLAAMASVAGGTQVPLATNMCVVAFEDLPEGVRLGASSIILGDLHYWGGLRASLELAGLCETFGLGMSMHSSAHLGITLAAMAQLGSVLPRVDYAFDTHWPWHTDDVVDPASFRFRSGRLAVPAGPGLGVQLDRDAVARMHERYRRGGLHRNDHTAYRQRFEPEFRPNIGRW